MNMIAIFRRLPDADAACLSQQPALLADYIDAEKPLAGFGESTEFDADKAWHAIHFLLTGTAWGGQPPLGFILHGGTTLGSEDLGHGPARAFTAREVCVIAAALRALPSQVLGERFDPAALAAAEIYPGVWHAPPGADDPRSFVVEYYEALRAFVLDAAQSGEAMLVYLS